MGGGWARGWTAALSWNRYSMAPAAARPLSPDVLLRLGNGTFILKVGIAVRCYRCIKRSVRPRR